MADPATAPAPRAFRLPALGTTQLVVALTLVGGLLRFATLDAKGFWEDEALTVFDLRPDLWDTVVEVRRNEGTPPLYYMLAWGWAKLFGTGEVGLRSLPALVGTATIPAAYLAARELLSNRAAVVAAGLVAVNPMLVWYSQEARSYALLVLLTTVSLLFFGRALRTPAGASAGTVGWWALASVLAVATHYFALFVAVPQALWLLYARRGLPGVRACTAAVLAVAVGAVALALVQRVEHSGESILTIGLFERVVQTPGVFLVGFDAPSPFLFAAIAAAPAAVAVWLLAMRADRGEREGAVLAGSVALAAFGTPLALSLVGFDYLNPRNVLAALVPVLIVLAAGFGAQRAGALGAGSLAVLCALSLGVLAITADEPKFRREDWRGVAEALGPARTNRAIVATPREPAREPLQLYLDADRMPSAGAAVREVVVVGGARRELGSTAEPEVPRPKSPPREPAPGFRHAGRHDAERFTLFRFSAGRPITVRPAELSRSRFDTIEPIVLLQRGNDR